MAYPSDLPTVTVRHRIVGTDGTPARGGGRVTAVLTGRLWTGQGSVVPTQYTATVQEDGTYELVLPPVDHPDIVAGRGEAYLVTEPAATIDTRRPGRVATEQFHVAPTADMVGQTVDVSDVLVNKPKPGGGVERVTITGPATDESLAGIIADPSSQTAVTLKDTIGAEVEPVQTALTDLKNDPRLPQHNDSADAEDLLAGVVDSAGNRTWMEARAEDGGPTDWALGHVERRLTGLAQRYVGDNDVLFAVTDDDDRLTDLTVRRRDGQFPDFVIDRLARRLRERLAGGFLSTDRYLRDGELLPVTADMSTIAGWGSSSMQLMSPYFSALMADVGVTHYAGGKGGERTQQIAARVGSIPARLSFPDDTVPASGTVPVSWPEGEVGASSLRAYYGTAAGVPGRLAWDGAALAFTRTGTGDPVPLDGPVEFIPVDGLAHRASVTLLWMGKNNMADPATVIAQTDATFDWLAPLVKRTLVLGHFVNTGTPQGDPNRVGVETINAAHAARYGDLFIDVQGYLSSPAIWADTGITPTQADLDAQAAGMLPPSVSQDSGHLNSAGSLAVAHLVHDRMTALGWY